MTILIILFAIHWIFDYVFQARSIADTKWDSIYSLTTHALIYSIGLIIFLISVAGFHGEISRNNFFMFIFMNTLFHWITDFFTSKATHMYYENKNYHAFFCVLGFDQLLHITALLSTVQWYLNIGIK